MVLLHRLHAVGHRMAKAAALALLEEVLHRLAQPALVVLDRQHIVAASGRDLRGNVFLAANGIDRHDAALEREHSQQCLDTLDLVPFALCTLLPQAHPAVGGKGADHVQGRVASIA